MVRTFGIKKLLPKLINVGVLCIESQYFINMLISGLFAFKFEVSKQVLS